MSNSEKSRELLKDIQLQEFHLLQSIQLNRGER